jgi:hypothetical protein
MLYVANEQHGIDVVGLGSGKCVERIKCDTGSVALAMSPDQRFLYAGYPRRGRVGLIALASLEPRGMLETGGRPGQLAFDGNGRVILVNEAGWLDIVPVGRLELASSQS